jgi:hypothetical protein
MKSIHQNRYAIKDKIRERLIAIAKGDLKVKLIYELDFFDGLETAHYSHSQPLRAPSLVSTYRRYVEKEAALFSVRILSQ